jgi:hypothetical protein
MSLSTAFFCESSWTAAAAPGPVQLGLGDGDLLVGGLVAGVDLGGAQELLQRAGKIAILAQDAALIDMLYARLEAHAVQLGEIPQVLGLLLVGGLVVLVGRIIVLPRLGIDAALIPLGGRLRIGGSAREQRQAAKGEDRQSRCSAPEEAGCEGGLLGRVQERERKPTAHAGCVRFLCTVRSAVSRTRLCAAEGPAGTEAEVRKNTVTAYACKSFWLLRVYHSGHFSLVNIQGAAACVGRLDDVPGRYAGSVRLPRGLRVRRGG